MLRWLLGMSLSAIALYGLHRLFLWMEKQGWIYYLRKSRQGSSVGSLLELQKALEPKMEHVIELKDRRESRGTLRKTNEGDGLEKNGPPPSP